MVQKKIFVKKMNGDMEEYDENKLRNSLRKVGADEKAIKGVMGKVSNILHDGIETKKLFKMIITRDSYIYKSGLEKYTRAIQMWKELFG